MGTSDKVSGGRTAPDAGDAGPVDGAGSLPTAYKTTFTKVNRKKRRAVRPDGKQQQKKRC